MHRLEFTKDVVDICWAKEAGPFRQGDKSFGGTRLETVEGGDDGKM